MGLPTDPKAVAVSATPAERAATESGGASAASDMLCDSHVTAWRDWRHGQAQRFLRRLDPEAEGFTFQVFDDTPQKRRELARVTHGSFDSVADALEGPQEQRVGVFVTVGATD